MTSTSFPSRHNLTYLLTSFKSYWIQWCCYYWLSQICHGFNMFVHFCWLWRRINKKGKYLLLFKNFEKQTIFAEHFISQSLRAFSRSDTFLAIFWLPLKAIEFNCVDNTDFLKNVMVRNVCSFSLIFLRRIVGGRKTYCCLKNKWKWKSFYRLVCFSIAFTLFLLTYFWTGWFCFFTLYVAVKSWLVS